MHRRTLDIIFSVGGLLLAILLAVLGGVLQNQADFAKDYVHNQLAAQQIVFTPKAGLKTDENAQCLKNYAGKALVTGKQAECYANHYIAVHLKNIGQGKTYSQVSGEHVTAQAQADAAVKAGSADAATLTAAAQKLDGTAQTLFRGETLRGLLLTSYGFSIFGERAQQAAWVCFAVAFVLLIASIAGFVHAFTTPKERLVHV